jgi:hypothetical protein
VTALVDRTGHQYGRLIVVSRAENDKRGNARWTCICECGKELVVAAKHLCCDDAQLSCGCEPTERKIERLRAKPIGLKHGQSRTTEYYACQNARNRCVNPKHPKYPHYGGRGVQFRFPSIAACVECLGPRPTMKHSIDRINNDGHYEPGNVKWSTMKEQNNNKRPQKRRVTTEKRDS